MFVAAILPSLPVGSPGATYLAEADSGAAASDPLGVQRAGATAAGSSRPAAAAAAAGTHCV